MIITDIQPRRKSLYALYIDGEFFENIDKKTVSENGIKKDMKITQEKLNELIHMSNERRAKERALWLISYRDYTKKELIDKIKKDTNEESAISAVERMEELGLVNDEKYAKKYAKFLLETKLVSKRHASYMLYQKGVPRELTDIVLEEFYIDPKDQIKQLIEKKYIRNLNSEKGIRRTVNALQRIGHNWSDIKIVLEEYTDSLY